MLCDYGHSAICCALQLQHRHVQLVNSGERERLKQLLREKLTECGWRDDIKQRCRGKWHKNRTFMLVRLVSCPSGQSATDTVHTTLFVRSQSPHATPWCHDLFADYIQRRGRENVTTEDIVRHIRPDGRAAVPDNIKAELLVEIKTFILQL